MPVSALENPFGSQRLRIGPRSAADDSEEGGFQRRRAANADVGNGWRRMPLVLQCGWRIAGNETSAVENGDAIAQLVGFGHVVGSEYHRARGVLTHPPADECPHLPRGRAVEPERRLIEQHTWGLDAKPRSRCARCR